MTCASSRRASCWRRTLGGRPGPRVARALRRGTRQQLYRRSAPRFRPLPARPCGAQRGVRRRPDGAARFPGTSWDEPVHRDRGACGQPALQDLPRGQAGTAFREPADARAPGRARDAGASVPDRSGKRNADLDRRPRADLCGRPRAAGRLGARVSGDVRRDVERAIEADDFNRLVLRARLQRASHRAARLRQYLRRPDSTSARCTCRLRSRPAGDRAAAGRAVQAALRPDAGCRPRLRCTEIAAQIERRSMASRSSTRIASCGSTSH